MADEKKKKDGISIKETVPNPSKKPIIRKVDPRLIYREATRPSKKK